MIVPTMITTTATMIAITFALVLMLPIGFLIELFLELLGIIFSFLDIPYAGIQHTRHTIKSTTAHRHRDTSK